MLSGIVETIFDLEQIIKHNIIILGALSYSRDDFWVIAKSLHNIIILGPILRESGKFPGFRFLLTTLIIKYAFYDRIPFEAELHIFTDKKKKPTANVGLAT